MNKIKVGKLYFNKNSRFLYDKVLQVTDMNDGNLLNKEGWKEGWVEYVWLVRPNKGYQYALVSLIEEQWVEINERTADWQNLLDSSI